MTRPDLVDLADLREMVADGRARQLRESANLSRADIGRAAGIGEVTVWRWENGKRRPTGSAALRYARVLRLLEQRHETVTR